MNMAIDYCIDHDILAEFLRKYRSEVLGMLLEEFDVKNMREPFGKKEEKRKESLSIN